MYSIYKFHVSSIFSNSLFLNIRHNIIPWVCFWFVLVTVLLFYFFYCFLFVYFVCLFVCQGSHRTFPLSRRRNRILFLLGKWQDHTAEEHGAWEILLGPLLENIIFHKPTSLLICIFGNSTTLGGERETCLILEKDSLQETSSGWATKQRLDDMDQWLPKSVP